MSQTLQEFKKKIIFIATRASYQDVEAFIRTFCNIPEDTSHKFLEVIEDANTNANAMEAIFSAQIIVRLARTKDISDVHLEKIVAILASYCISYCNHIQHLPVVKYLSVCIGLSIMRNVQIHFGASPEIFASQLMLWSHRLPAPVLPLVITVLPECSDKIKLRSCDATLFYNYCDIQVDVLLDHCTSMHWSDIDLIKLFTLVVKSMHGSVGLNRCLLCRYFTELVAQILMNVSNICATILDESRVRDSMSSLCIELFVVILEKYAALDSQSSDQLLCACRIRIGEVIMSLSTIVEALDTYLSNFLTRFERKEVSSVDVAKFVSRCYDGLFLHISEAFDNILDFQGLSIDFVNASLLLVSNSGAVLDKINNASNKLSFEAKNKSLPIILDFIEMLLQFTIGLHFEATKNGYFDKAPIIEAELTKALNMGIIFSSCDHVSWNIHHSYACSDLVQVSICIDDINRFSEVLEEFNILLESTVSFRDSLRDSIRDILWCSDCKSASISPVTADIVHNYRVDLESRALAYIVSNCSTMLKAYLISPTEVFGMFSAESWLHAFSSTGKLWQQLSTSLEKQRNLSSHHSRLLEQQLPHLLEIYTMINSELVINSRLLCKMAVVVIPDMMLIFDTLVDCGMLQELKPRIDTLRLQSLHSLMLSTFHRETSNSVIKFVLSNEQGAHALVEQRVDVLPFRVKQDHIGVVSLGKVVERVLLPAAIDMNYFKDINLLEVYFSMSPYCEGLRNSDASDARFREIILQLHREAQSSRYVCISCKTIAVLVHLFQELLCTRTITSNGICLKRQPFMTFKSFQTSFDVVLQSIIHFASKSIPPVHYAMLLIITVPILLSLCDEVTAEILLNHSLAGCLFIDKSLDADNTSKLSKEMKSSSTYVKGLMTQEIKWKLLGHCVTAGYNLYPRESIILICNIFDFILLIAHKSHRNSLLEFAISAFNLEIHHFDSINIGDPNLEVNQCLVPRESVCLLTKLMNFVVWVISRNSQLEASISYALANILIETRLLLQSTIFCLIKYQQQFTDYFHELIVAYSIYIRCVIAFNQTSLVAFNDQPMDPRVFVGESVELVQLCFTSISLSNKSMLPHTYNQYDFLIGIFQVFQQLLVPTQDQNEDKDRLCYLQQLFSSNAVLSYFNQVMTAIRILEQTESEGRSSKQTAQLIQIVELIIEQIDAILGDVIMESNEMSIHIKFPEFSLIGDNQQCRCSISCGTNMVSRLMQNGFGEYYLRSVHLAYVIPTLLSLLSIKAAMSRRDMLIGLLAKAILLLHICSTSGIAATPSFVFRKLEPLTISSLELFKFCSSHVDINIRKHDSLFKSLWLSCNDFNWKKFKADLKQFSKSAKIS